MLRRTVALFGATLVFSSMSTVFVQVAHAARTAPVATVAFDDEFNATSLDSTKWQPNWRGDTDAMTTNPVSSEINCYDPAQVTEPGDGYLHLTAVARSCKVQSSRNHKTYAYASGLVNTHATYLFSTGTLEARVYTPPAGPGVVANWPAVWTDGTGRWPTTGESDVMEGIAGQACWHYHGPTRSSGNSGCPAGDFTGWHTYAEKVTPTTTTYFYDGVNVGSSPNVYASHYIVLNLAVGGFGGPTVTPATMLVDYIRVTPP